MSNGRIIAMWSAPRNISTAMMRAWENRADTHVVDEPYYANYLSVTGIDHPMAAQIIEQGETDWRRINERLNVVPETGIFYQKQITTHILPHINLDWIESISNVFLIRDPRQVIASYAAKRESVNAGDLGYDLQANVFEQVKNLVAEPLVIDSSVFLNDPKQQLTHLCQRLGIEFDDAMLKWPAGARDSDGIWHTHWYDSVKKSTGFSPQRSQYPDLSDELKSVADECMPYYQALKKYAIQP
jgi:hypothetical protein